MIVLGLDPSLTAYGWALVDIDGNPLLPPGERTPRVLDAGCVRTAPEPKKKRHAYQADADAKRLMEIADVLDGIMSSGHGPTQRVPLRIVCEAPAGSQHAVSAKALGQSLGVTIGVVMANGRRIRFVQAHEVQVAMTGTRNASKEAVALGVERITNWRSTAKTKVAREAEADAVAVALTLRRELMEER